MAARFYVYQITDGDEIVYIGKGSGNRIKVQERAFRGTGSILERFESEAAAYSAERKFIASRRPSLNRHPGGNGSRARLTRKARKDKWEKCYDQIGPRRYSARLLLACEQSRPGIIDPSKIDVIRQVAYGEWS